MQYTKKEMTEPRHDLNFIMKQVRDVVDDKTKHRSHNNPVGICLNKLPRCRDDQLFTTAAASEIIDGIVDDSLYYANPY